MTFTTFALALVVAVALTWPVVRFAARRTSAQPVDVHPDLERVVMHAVLAHPRTFAHLSLLSPDMFATPALAGVWAAVHELVPGVVPPDHLDDAQTQAFQLAAEDLVPQDLAVQLLHRYPEHTEVLKRTVVGPPPRHADAIAAAEQVREDAYARQMSDTIVVLDEHGVPVTDRTEPRSTRARLAVAGVMLTAGFTAALSLPVTGPAGVLAALAVAVLTVGSVVWALVDHDTLYIDTATFWPLAGTAWALVAGMAAITGDWSAVQLAVACTLVVAAVFMGASLGYRLVRGRFGMGGGDAILVLATVGVPVAVTGHWTVAYAAVMAALGLALVTGVAARKAGRAFAFGPALCAGWMVAVLAENAHLLPW